MKTVRRYSVTLQRDKQCSVTLDLLENNPDMLCITINMGKDGILTTAASLKNDATDAKDILEYMKRHG